MNSNCCVISATDGKSAIEQMGDPMNALKYSIDTYGKVDGKTYFVHTYMREALNYGMPKKLPDDRVLLKDWDEVRRRRANGEDNVFYVFSDDDALYHQYPDLKPGDRLNLKIGIPDGPHGSKEGIYDPNNGDMLVTDVSIYGTYNFYNVGEKGLGVFYGLGHGFADLFTYYDMGAVPNEQTNIIQRFMGPNYNKMLDALEPLSKLEGAVNRVPPGYY